MNTCIGRGLLNRNLSIGGVAAVSRVNAGTISRLEMGLYAITKDVAAKLVDALNIDPILLLNLPTGSRDGIISAIKPRQVGYERALVVLDEGDIFAMAEAQKAFGRPIPLTLALSWVLARRIAKTDQGACKY